MRNQLNRLTGRFFVGEEDRHILIACAAAMIALSILLVIWLVMIPLEQGKRFPIHLTRQEVTSLPIVTVVGFAFITLLGAVRRWSRGKR